MEPETSRLDDLERRMVRLEQRLAALEVPSPDAAARDRGAGDRADPAFLRAWGLGAAGERGAPDAAGAGSGTAARVHRLRSAAPPPPPGWPPVPVPMGVAPGAAPNPAPRPGPVAPPAASLAQPSAPAAGPHGRRWSFPATVAPDAPRLSLRDLEERFAGRALAWVGGVALVGAALFFLSLAFSRGWITEPMRVLTGLGAGTVAVVAGAVLLSRASALLGNVLSGVGLGIITIALLAATRLYGLVPPEVGLLGAMAAAAAAAAIAVAYDARSVAAYGLVAALVAPPLVGAPPTVLTLLFVAVVLVGTTAVSLFRSWRWLPQIAFVLAAPQLAAWIAGGPDRAQALVALAGFWLVNVLAAGGEEVRIRRDDLRPSSATLVLANAAFLVWGLLVVVDGPLAGYRGVAVATASLAHLAVGGAFLRRQGWHHLFGNLVAATGVALLALATFLQLDAPAVPVAWAAEAVALAWLARRRLHRWSALAALALGTLAALHLVVVEYPADAFTLPPGVPVPPHPVHPSSMALLALVAAAAVTAALVPVRWVRSALAAAAIVALAWAAPFEARGPALAGLLAVLGVAAVAIDRALARTGEDEVLRQAMPPVTIPRVATVAALVPAILAVAVLLAVELPVGELGRPQPAPFRNAPFLSLALVLVGFAGAGALLPLRRVRSALAGAGILLLGWGLAFQLDGPALVVGLAALLPAAILVDRGLAVLDGSAAGTFPADGLGTAAGIVGWGTGALLAALGEAPPWDWGVVTPPAIPFTDGPALAFGALVAAALAGVALLPWPGGRRAALLAAVVAGAWVAPVELFADGIVVAWVALALVAVPAARRDPGAATGYALGAGVLWTAAASVALSIVATPDRLAVADPAVRSLPLLAGWPLAFAALVAALLVAARVTPLVPARRALEAGAAALALYAVSVAVVDVFVRRAGGSIALDELATQAQVALSVCWTAIGAVALAIGFARHAARARHAGLLLLGLATAKVFLVDLAAMDVAYRAVVLAGLGLLLLVSAWIATRSRGPRAGRGTLAGGPGPIA